MLAFPQELELPALILELRPIPRLLPLVIVRVQRRVGQGEGLAEVGKRFNLLHGRDL